MHIRSMVIVLALLVTGGAQAQEALSPGQKEEVQKEQLPVEDIRWRDFDASGDHPFKTTLHAEPQNVASWCSWQLALAQWKQDLGEPRRSEAHFDNCAFDGGVEFIEERLTAADRAVQQKKFDKAMYILGQALHALQDFYSHSSFVEMMVRRHPKEPQKVTPIALWTAAGQQRLRALIAEGLISGVVGYSRAESKKCAAGSPTHETIAKDSPTFSAHAQTPIPGWKNRTYHVAALDLANRASEDFLAFAFRQWPELARQCAKPVGYLPITERRKDAQ
ncbi:MAG TPA: HET-C-related protein [Thermoanaerobaculia bacterium]|jgi:hypothetical protein